MAGRPIGAEARARAREVAREIGSQPDDVETVAVLLELGVRPDEMRQALERGRLEDAIFDAVLDPARRERTVTPAEIEARGGLTAAEIALQMQTAGLSAPGPDDPWFTEKEAHVFLEVARLRDVWTSDLMIQLSRVSGRALGRIAQAQVQLFRLHVEPRLRAESGDRVAALPDVHWAFEQLLPLAEPWLAAVHRRLFERELTEVAIRQAETRSSGGTLPGATQAAILFCDLKDFTAYAAREGEEAAVAVIENLSVVVTEECGSTGRVVKGLGDGYMLAFSEARDAVGTGWRVIERHREDAELGIHASLHEGLAVVHGGDYFGTVVNVAARILAAAKRDELMATAAVATSTSEDFGWEDVGASYVRGVSGTVDLFRLVGPLPDRRS
ncbi:MAG TPA: adenylate/guanylate cyclase domain-containing protein [Thermoleophilaceae bacterium]